VTPSSAFTPLYVTRGPGSAWLYARKLFNDMVAKYEG
jgi:hypothetical protein